ncbi:MAG: DUF4445 domain-containing protein [Lachnospiraceae bacterium]|nr:DUF4445 domain-containing protein [Lachnospiraceae bacterium]
MPTNSYKNNSDKDLRKGVPFVYDGGLPFFACVCDYLKDNGYSYSVCGGNYGAKCGRCKVRFEEGAPLPDAIERKLLSPDELREGVRLACRSNPKAGSKLSILFGAKTAIIAETAKINLAAMPDRDAVGIDLGTSTLAFAFWDSNEKKQILHKADNPQIKYGSDVISRIDAANKYGREFISEELLDFLYEGLLKVADGKDIKSLPVYVAGNTVMLHVLSGEDATGLGAYPFTPAFLDERKITYKDATFTLLPGISAFVGADITAGLISEGILPVSAMSKGKLFIDLGTNAETALSDGEKVYCTACAAGSAFSTDAGIGSEGISAIAKLLQEGIIDETGLLKEENGAVTQKSVREIQLAKAAVASGIEILLGKSGMSKEDIQSVSIAGGFGYFLNVEDAAQIGLLPKELKDVARPGGNTCLQGCLMYDKVRKELGSFRNDFVAIDSATEPNFDELYMRQVNF